MSANPPYPPELPWGKYKFFLYDPNNGSELYETRAELDTALKTALDRYFDGDGWCEDADLIYAGEITHGVKWSRDDGTYKVAGLKKKENE